MCSKYSGIRLELVSGLEMRQKLKISRLVLTSSTQRQNRSFHVVESTRTAMKCTKIKTARAKRAKLPFFIVKYANLWRSRRLWLSWSLKLPNDAKLRSGMSYSFRDIKRNKSLVITSCGANFNWRRNNYRKFRATNQILGELKSRLFVIQVSWHRP